jgi:regulator of sigma D
MELKQKMIEEEGLREKLVSVDHVEMYRIEIEKLRENYEHRIKTQKETHQREFEDIMSSLSNNENAAQTTRLTEMREKLEATYQKKLNRIRASLKEQYDKKAEEILDREKALKEIANTNAEEVQVNDNMYMLIVSAATVDYNRTKANNRNSSRTRKAASSSPSVRDGVF